ncbi:MAG: trigger factor [Alphaproteobacteria bacterium]|nr:trigger factor [Alphaproteobacteria bacterium]
MKITENKSKGLSKSFNITVPVDEFQAEYKAKLKETAEKVKIPGFRPGNTPINIVEQKYGQAVKGDAAESLIQKATEQVLTENKLKQANTPKINVIKFEDGKDFEFSIDLEVLPTIKPVDFSKVKVEKLVADVTEEEINKALKRLADSHRETEVISEKRPTQNGDVVVIDFTGTIEGKEFRGGSGKDFYLALGSNTFIPGFEEQLVGKNVGDRVMVNVNFPMEYHVKEFAGKPAQFETVIKELRKYKETSLDDDFAKAFGQDTIGALKTLVKNELAKEYGNVSKIHLKRAILDALAPLCDFEAPESMVDMEFDAIWKQFEAAKARGQLDEDEKKAKEEDLKKEYKDIAVRRVKLGLLLAGIADQNDIKLTREDIQKAIMAEVAHYPGKAREITEFYQRNPQALESLKAPIFEEKVIDFITGKIQMTEKKMTPEELYAFDPDKK